MIWLHCLVDDPPSLEELRDLRFCRQRVCLFIHPDLGGAVTPLPALPKDIHTVRMVQEYHDVIETLFGRRTVLPVRYGTVFASLRDLQREIDASAGQLRAVLRSVHGHVEMGVRALWHRGPVVEPRAREPAGPPGTLSGIEYLKQRSARWKQNEQLRRDAEDLAGPIHALLADGAARSQLTLLVTERLFFSGAYLVPRDSIPPFHQKLNQVRRAYPELDFLCTGPWPPYSFARPPEGGVRI